MRLLVTGGAGYVGSHVARQLVEAGHDVVVYDDLSTGHRWAVLGAELVEGDMRDQSHLDRLFAERGFDGVLHFAARVVVPESLADPLGYYRNNTVNTLGLLELIHRHRVGWLVFSSTAAVYGMADDRPVRESSIPDPISPYGASKLMSETMIRDFGNAQRDFRYVILRYFNVAGADPEARIGQATANATHLIKVACEAAVGRREGITIYGTDYPTPDGTCIRDYIHVEDLAAAHVAAMEHLGAGGESVVLNCGYGRGVSVREVLEAVQRVAGVAIDITEGPRRPGDPASLVADSSAIQAALGWTPRYQDLETIVRHALAWEQRLTERSRQ